MIIVPWPSNATSKSSCTKFFSCDQRYEPRPVHLTGGAPGANWHWPDPAQLPMNGASFWTSGAGPGAMPSWAAANGAMSSAQDRQARSELDLMGFLGRWWDEEAGQANQP